MFDFIDSVIADILEISVEEYINKIEETTEHRAEVIIDGLLSEDPLIIEKAKKIFKLL